MYESEYMIEVVMNLMVQGRIVYQYVYVLCIYQTFYNNAACSGFVNSIGLSLRSMRHIGRF